MGEQTLADAALEAQYPNPEIGADRRKVIAAGATLITVAVLVWVMAADWWLTDPSELMIPLTLVRVLGTWWLIEGGVTLLAGVLTLRSSYAAAVTGVVLACLGLVLAFLTFNGLAVLVRAAMVVLVARGMRALRRVNHRIDSREQANPLTAYYHHLIPLLVHVMGADGHADRRERRKIVDICDHMNISRYEQDRIIDRAVARPVADLDVEVERYLAAARRIGLVQPENQLVMAAVAVAGADGVIAAPEEDAIRKLGSLTAIAEPRIDRLLAQRRRELSQMTPQLARALLDVSEADGREQVEAAYQKLVDELRPPDVSHLGGGLESYVAERNAALERARAYLLADAL